MSVNRGNRALFWVLVLLLAMALLFVCDALLGQQCVKTVQYPSKGYVDNYKKQDNAIKLSGAYFLFSLADLGTGVQLEYSIKPIKDINFYSSITWGDGANYHDANVGYHVQASTGVVLPLYLIWPSTHYNDCRINLLLGLNYNYVSSPLTAEEWLDPIILEKYSPDTGFEVIMMEHFTFVFKLDIHRWGEPKYGIGYHKRF